MREPIDPTEKQAMALWARTPFANNDYLTVQAIHAYWSEDDASRYGMTQAELDDCLFADAQEMYQAIVPPECVVVRRDDLRFVLDEFGWRELRYGSFGIEDVHKRLNAALGDGEHVTEQE